MKLGKKSSHSRCGCADGRACLPSHLHLWVRNYFGGVSVLARTTCWVWHDSSDFGGLRSPLRLPARCGGAGTALEGYFPAGHVGWGGFTDHRVSSTSQIDGERQNYLPLTSAS